MKVLAIIPARFNSTRFPGKVLAEIEGKPMLQWVHQAAATAENISRLVVATDSEEVKKAAEKFSAEVVMTSNKHISGTDRCCEAYERLQEEHDVVLNIQCDLPLLKPEVLEKLIACFEDAETRIATLCAPIKEIEKLDNPNVVKVIIDDFSNAIYFSRTAIPYCRDVEKSSWLDNHNFNEHMGLYAYRPDALMEVVKLHPTDMEQAEKLEQLRWIEHGYKIKVGKHNEVCIGVDTPDDLQRVIDKLLLQKNDS